MFTRGLVADVIRAGWTGELGLVDTDPDALAVAEGLARKMLAAAGAPLRLSAHTDRREVLPGATVVICTIGVGGRRAWEQDVLVPRRYGIYQPVGDSVMPGGTSRALRMIPPMVAIARDVLDRAPGALFFNYGNPMSPVCRAIHKATGAGVVGLCHGVFHVARYIAEQLGVPCSALQYTAVGMNHLTWFTAASVNGADAMPRLQAVARERLGRGIAAERLGARFAEAGTAPRGAPTDEENPFTWQLMDLFGAFPAVLDRHITEFFAPLFAGRGAYYGKTLGVDAYSFEATIARGDEEFERMRALALSPLALPADYGAHLEGEHEQATEIVDSIRHGAGRVYSANLPNRGQIRTCLPAPWSSVRRGRTPMACSRSRNRRSRPAWPGRWRRGSSGWRRS